MPFILSQDPGIAAIQSILIILMVILIGVATHLATLLILKFCRKKPARRPTPAKSPEAAAVADTLKRLRERQEAENPR